MPQDQQERGAAQQPLLERRTPLGGTVALAILLAFFFLMPFAFRAARLSLNKKENDIKDWLPSDFVETSELAWFGQHFAGESFVIATWPGCNAEDQRLKLLESKLRHESSQADPAEGIADRDLADDYRSAKEYGTRLGLLPTTRELDGWGGENEKWFATADGLWYYILPNGHLHRWEEKSNGPAGLIRNIKRSLGRHQLSGTFVAAFGDQKNQDGTPNPFHDDPSLLCAPMFRTIETGVSLVSELAKEGGLLWPVDLTDPSRRGVVAERRAMERLTGSMFAPAVPKDFDWSADAFRDQVPADRRDEIPENFAAIVEKALSEFVEESFAGEKDRLATASDQLKADAWYRVFDAAEVPPPPRQTCLLITLTDIAQDNLAYALGRGVLGAPQGRLLQLARDSGVQPAASPSLAPPPFNRPDVESVAGAPPLRLGGPPVDNIAIDEEGTITLVRLVGYSVLVGALLSYLCFTSIKITIMVFIVGGSAAMLSMAFVSWTGGHVDAILMSMPSLVYVLGLSGSIHVINYYRDEVRQGGRSGAAGRALRHAVFPCSLAALTTAIGLASLYTSNLAPISNFGLYAAIGVIATLAILFSYLPAALQVFVTESKTDPVPGRDDPSAKESWLSDRWAAAGNWICRHHALVSVCCLAALLGAAMGLSKIKTSVQLLKLFDPNARIIRDYAWLESNFGKLVPMELVLRIPPSMQQERVTDSGLPFNLLERVEAVARINHVVRQTLGPPGLDVVGSTTAINTFLKPLPAVSNGWDPIRSQYLRDLSAGRDELLASDYVRLEQQGPYQDSELWRISLRVGALSDVDYGQFIKTLRTAVEPVLRAYDTRDQIISSLAKDPDLVNKKKPLIVMMGASDPQPFFQTGFIDTESNDNLSDEQRIMTRQIYLATLKELLKGERFQSPIWVDPDSTERPVPIGGEKWNRVVDRSDLFVWVGDQPAPKADLSGASQFIDGKAILDKSISHALLDDATIPEAVGSGALQVVYTGVVPVVYKAQRTLLGSLVQSIGLAFVLIAIVMVVLLNPAKSPLRMLAPGNVAAGLFAGMTSMIPNMFPVLLVFGLMGHFGRLVDIGTMMTASVAMGVAVDDTIHFLSWFRSYLDRGYDRVRAIEMMTTTTIPAATRLCSVIRPSIRDVKKSSVIRQLIRPVKSISVILRLIRIVKKHFCDPAFDPGCEEHHCDPAFDPGCEEHDPGCDPKFDPECEADFEWDPPEVVTGAPIMNGSYEVNVPEGTYRVIAFVEGNGSFANTEVTVTVPANTDVELDIELQSPDATIEARLINAGTGEVITGIDADVFAWSRANFADGRVDPTTGIASIPVVAGDWHVDHWVHDQTYVPIFSEDNKVTVESGETVTVDLLVGVNNATVSGTVRDPDGNGMPRAAVVLIGQDDLDGVWIWQEADQDGNFTLLAPEGSFKLEAAWGGDSNGEDWFWPLPIEVTTSEETPVTDQILDFRRADLTLTGTVNISGTTFAEDEAPFAFIYGWSDTGGFNHSEVQLYTDGSSITGTYSMAVISGTWNIGAVYEDGTEFWFDHQEINIDDDASADFDLEQGDPLPPSDSQQFDAEEPFQMEMADGTELSIPPGAMPVTGTVTLSIEPVATLPDQDHADVLSYGYSILARDENGQTIEEDFDEEVTIKFPYFEADLNGIPEDELVPAYFSTTNNQWTVPNNYVVDTEENVITMRISHFTDFAVVGDPATAVESGNDLYLPFIVTPN